MRCLITYDLAEPNDTPDDYEAVIHAIKLLYPEHNHMQYSVFLVTTASSAAKVRDALQMFIKGDSSLFVTPIRGWSSYKLSKDTTAWLERTE